MDFRLLGPLEVDPGDGRPAGNLARRERQLMSVLLLRAGRPCTLDLLTRVLWPGGPPGSPARALRTSVSRARRALRAAGCITTLDGGYRADPPPGTLDAGRFLHLEAAARDAAAGGDLAGAAARWQEALRCWRDPPLADLPDVPETRPDAARLLERRWQAALGLSAARIALGQHDAVLPDLHARVITSPACEQAWEQLVLALSRSGRHADALAACDRARRALAQARSTAPGPALRAMHAALLDGRPLPAPDDGRLG